jgi:hypothetical protein
LNNKKKMNIFLHLILKGVTSIMGITGVARRNRRRHSLCCWSQLLEVTFAIDIFSSSNIP